MDMRPAIAIAGLRRGCHKRGMSTLAPLVTDRWPTVYSRSEHFHLHLDGQPQDVFPTPSAHLAVVVGAGSQTLRITCASPPQHASVHPARLGISATVHGHEVRIQATMPANLYIQIDDLPRLYLFASHPEQDRPDPADPRVHYLPAGQVHHSPCLELDDGETLYLEHGAVLRGCVRSYGSTDVAIRGPGIIDGGRYSKQGDTTYRHLIRWENCRDVSVQDVTLLDPCAWTHVLAGCERVQVSNIHQVGHGGGNDGIDVMSSRDVTIRGGFIHSGDDCIVVKAMCEANGRQRLAMSDERADDQPSDWRTLVAGPTERLHASGCVLMNDGGGNALEIGHELRSDRTSDITFSDIDILGSHGHGAVFSIHNCDAGTVERIRFQDIHVEHHYDKLFSLRITKSRYAHDEAYGRIRDVEFRNLHIAESPLNPGYTCSVIGGKDAESDIRDLRFIDVRLGERTLASFDDFDCYHKHVHEVHFSES